MADQGLQVLGVELGPCRTPPVDVPQTGGEEENVCKHLISILPSKLPLTYVGLVLSLFTPEPLQGVVRPN